MPIDEKIINGDKIKMILKNNLKSLIKKKLTKIEILERLFPSMSEKSDTKINNINALRISEVRFLLTFINI